MDVDVTDLLAARRRKLAAVRADGVNAFPNDFTATHTTAEVEAQFGGLTSDQLAERREVVAVGGRIIARRDFGRASFLHLQDRAGRLQAYVKRDGVGEAAFALFKQMELSGRRRASEVLSQLGFLPGTAMVIRGDELVPEHEMLEADDIVEIRSVISGGS